MKERFPDGNGNPEDKDKSTRKKALLTPGIIGGLLGGSTYGYSRILDIALGIGNERLANKLGIGIGGGLAASMSGLMFGGVSMEKAVKLAKDGQKRRARLKAVQASFETGIGMGESQERSQGLRQKV